VLYHTAPCGNQSPRFLVSEQTFDEAERLGRKLGKAVAASVAMLKGRDYRNQGPLRGVLHHVDLPRRALPLVAEAQSLLDRCRADYDRLRSDGADPARVRTAECAVFGAEGTLALATLQEQGEIERLLQAYLPIEIQAVQIGEVHLAGLPGECFTEYALEIKRRWPGRVFVVSLVNGDLQGYIVTEDAAALGGYEATTALFSPVAGRLLVEETLEALKGT
jgi:hypothetical protein